MIINTILYLFNAICILAFCFLATYILAGTIETFFKLFGGNDE